MALGSYKCTSDLPQLSHCSVESIRIDNTFQISACLRVAPNEVLNLI